MEDKLHLKNVFLKKEQSQAHCDYRLDSFKGFNLLNVLPNIYSNMGSLGALTSTLATVAFPEVLLSAQR